jgi:hypothetical protein
MLKIGEHIHSINPQKFGVAIFNISIFVDFMKFQISYSICVNLTGKVEQKKSAGKGRVEIALIMRILIYVPSKQF